MKKTDYYIFSKIELFVLLLLIVVLITFLTPNVLNIINRIKLNSALDSAYNYKESINKYYMSQLMIDSSFKLDGRYDISSGFLVNSEDENNTLFTGNVSNSGYLTFENNVLLYGCIVVNGYYIVFENDQMINYDSDCYFTENVDIAIMDM